MKLGKIFLIVVVTSLSGLLIFSGCCRKPRFCSKDFPEKVLSRIDSRVEKLELNDKQKLKYNEIRSEIKIDLTKGMAERQRVMREVIVELDAGEPDMNKIAKIVKKKHSERPDYFDKYVDRFVEFYYILDKKQKAFVVERLRKLGDRFSCE